MLGLLPLAGIHSPAPPESLPAARYPQLPQQNRGTDEPNFSSCFSLYPPPFLVFFLPYPPSNLGTQAKANRINRIRLSSEPPPSGPRPDSGTRAAPYPPLRSNNRVPRAVPGPVRRHARAPHPRHRDAALGGHVALVAPTSARPQSAPMAPWPHLRASTCRAQCPLCIVFGIGGSKRRAPSASIHFSTLDSIQVLPHDLATHREV